MAADPRVGAGRGAACWHLLGNAGVVAAARSPRRRRGRRRRRWSWRPPVAVGARRRSRSSAGRCWQEAPVARQPLAARGLVVVAAGGRRSAVDPARADAGRSPRPRAVPARASTPSPPSPSSTPASSTRTRQLRDLLLRRERPTRSASTARRSTGAAGPAVRRDRGDALIELSIPVLLVLAPHADRRRGASAVAFHAVLAVDRTHQFFDFSPCCSPLFVHVPARRRRRASGAASASRRSCPAAGAASAGAGRARRASSGRRGRRRRRSTPRRSTSAWLAWVGCRWRGRAGGRVVAVRRHRRERPAGPPRVRSPCRPPGARRSLLARGRQRADALPRAQDVGFGWNMYANLRTVDGDSEPLPRAARRCPLSDAQDDLVEVVETDDRGLAALRRRRAARCAWRQLRVRTSRTTPTASGVDVRR